MWFRIALMSTTALLLLSVFSRAEVKSMESRFRRFRSSTVARHRLSSSARGR